MQPFVTQLRVRHYEMDALGHVNNAVYQHYLEQAAIEHSESLGFTVERYRELGGVFVLRRVELEYLRPAVAGDVLEITTWLARMHGVRANRCYEIRREGSSDLLVQAEALWVWINAVTQRPQPIPKDMMAAFGQISRSTSAQEQS
jgi:acyl-CoA thioester hydrolase